MNNHGLILLSYFKRNTILINLNKINQITTAKSNWNLSQNQPSTTNDSQKIEKVSSTLGPINTKHVTNFEKYLIYKFSKMNFASPAEVPDVVPVTQVNSAKDKGRATATVILIGLTILGAVISIIIGKHRREKGIDNLVANQVKQHAEYSKAHQDIIKITQK